MNTSAERILTPVACPTHARVLPSVRRAPTFQLALVGLAVATVAFAGRAATGEVDVVRCRNGAVVSVSREASHAGLQALQHGGTAVDAAVATAFALCVTYPAAGNIGGGGYLLVVPGAADAESVVFDCRETAPAGATRDMFVDKAARTPHRRMGVPGTVRGLSLAHARGGKLPWRQLVMPAVELAKGGFALDAAEAAELNKVLARNDPSQFASLHRAFGRADDKPWQCGDRLVQPQLAAVLARIAEQESQGDAHSIWIDPNTREIQAAADKRVSGGAAGY